MEKEERSHQWSLAYFGLGAVLIGAIIGFSGSWYIWHLQQNAVDEQKLLEQQNIAHAIYLDISNIELNLNYTLISQYNMSQQNDINYIPIFAYPINNNWLYPIFCKDIAGFNNTTISEDIYNFYNVVAELEKDREFVFAIKEKDLHKENITIDETVFAHEYSKAIYTQMIPLCIRQAEKIKRELKSNYHINVRSMVVPLYNSRIYKVIPGVDIIV